MILSTAGRAETVSRRIVGRLPIPLPHPPPQGLAPRQQAFDGIQRAEQPRLQIGHAAQRAGGAHGDAAGWRGLPYCRFHGRRLLEPPDNHCHAGDQGAFVPSRGTEVGRECVRNAGDGIPFGVCGAVRAGVEAVFQSIVSVAGGNSGHWLRCIQIRSKGKYTYLLGIMSRDQFRVRSWAAMAVSGFGC